MGWSSSGPIFEDKSAESSRVSTVRLALKDIANAQGDVDAFITQYTGQARKMPQIAADIARRLLATRRAEEAQNARSSCFERSLSAPHLRAYLKRLPNFDDIKAEDCALDLAVGFSSPLRAVSFLTSWPSLDRAAGLILRRAGDLDGNYCEILTPAADALAEKHP